MTRRKVMISSTALDLPEHRQGLRDACERAGFEPHMMEKLPALDADAIEASLQMVDEADVYVGVFAYRYGYVPKGHDISITEMEYNRALELKKPRLIFFIDEAHPITGKDVETGDGATKLQALKDRIGQQRVAALFKSPGDLKGDVVAALTTLGKKLDTTAASGDAVASTVAKLHRKTSIPTAPEPYIAHPYTLLQSRELVGRQAELNALTEWIANPASRAFDARIFCFVAIGGMGKSALTWKWFNQIAPNEMKPLAGRIWWSFYESDATFENFLNRALCYVSEQSEEEVRALPWQEREAQLLQHLNETPHLFVLDGLERILIAYNRMDASSLADDEYDQKTANWVAGAAGLPPSAVQSFTGEHRLRQTTDLRAGAFLRKLAQVAQSRIVITTRLYPYALQLPTRDPYPGSAAYFLRGLSNDDAVALWRSLNVTGQRSELIPIFKSIENHPLLIQVFAGVVANYRKAPGNFDQWKTDHFDFDPTSLLVVQSRARILTFALDGLSAKIREVLHTIVGFRMPANYDTLEALLVGPAKACNSAQELDDALTELEDRGLIGWDREANRYDSHPIVRGVVWQLTEAKDQLAVYTALEAHFEPMATPEWEEVKSLAELTPAIERYHTLVGLGRYNDAWELFRDRLERATAYRLAAHKERIAWLERLLTNAVADPPKLADESAQASASNALSQSYMYAGQIRLSIPLLKRTRELTQLQENQSNERVALSNLGHALTIIGDFREASSVLRQALAIDLADERRSFWQGVILQFYGWMLSAIGDYTRANLALSRGLYLFREDRQRQAEGTISTFIAEHLFWLGCFERAGILADQAWELAADQNLQRDFVHAALLQGRIAVVLGNLERADERLHRALTDARTANIVQLELPTLITLSEFELKRGRAADAKVRLDDVWEAAERGPYPLYQTDAYNLLTDIELAENNKIAAIDAATKAYKAAWCDGPPYAYHWGLQKAKAHLAALGAPEPDMPPFDESKFEPLPEVEINPKDEYWVDPDKLD